MNGALSALLTVACAPLLTGYAAVPFFGRKPRGAFAGLLFHAIEPRGRAGFSHYRAGRFAALGDLMAASGIGAIPVREAVPDPSQGKIVLAFDDGFVDFHDVALEILRKHDCRATVFPVAGYLGRSSSWDVFPALPHLTAGHLRAIAAQGHEVGSHTVTHADLTRLAPRDLDRELGDSRKLIEDAAGAPVSSLSFPCGRWNRRVWERAQELGYRSATVYTRTSRRLPGMVPLTAAYAFDTPQDLLARIGAAPHSAVGSARAWIMAHFAKGTSLYRWRREYR